MSNANDYEIRNGVLIQYNGNNTDIVIPDGVTAIYDSAFDDCSVWFL